MKKILSLIYCSFGVLALVAGCDSNKTEVPQKSSPHQVTASTKTKEQIKEEQRRAMSTEAYDTPDNLDKPLPIRR